MNKIVSYLNLFACAGLAHSRLRLLLTGRICASPLTLEPHKLLCSRVDCSEIDLRTFPVCTGVTAIFFIVFTSFQGLCCP
jgi:hypothetical protein